MKPSRILLGLILIAALLGVGCRPGPPDEGTAPVGGDTAVSADGDGHGPFSRLRDLIKDAHWHSPLAATP